MRKVALSFPFILIALAIAGTATVPFELFANSLFDGLAGFLGAPESDATRQRADGSVGVDAPRLRLL